MIFDIIFLVSDRKLKTKEERITKPEPEILRIFIRPENFQRMQILKDPVEDNVTTYSLEFVNLDKDIINYIKNNIVENIVVRVGKITQSSPTPNYNLLKLYIKPIKVSVPDPERLTVNHVTVTGIGANTFAMMVDKSFSTNMSAPENLQEVSVETGYAWKTEKTKSTYNNSSITSSSSSRNTLNTANYNPGNLERNDGNAWLGKNWSNTSRFEQFSSPEAGFRALILNIQSYRKNYGLNTLRKIINRWAPKSDGNDPTGYAAMLKKFTGLNMDDPISDSDLANIAKGISWVEGDNKAKFYTDEMINGGAILAGVSSYTTYPGSIGINNANMSTIELINAGIPIRNPNTISNGDTTNYGNTGYINKDSMKTGINILNNIVNSLTNKYGMFFLNDPVVTGGVSNFVYKNVYTPNLSAFDLIKHVYEWYPPFYLNNPWLIDDAYYIDGENTKVGQIVFTPLNIFNINALPSADVAISTFINSITGDSSVTSVFNIVDRNFYYKDYDLPKFKTICYNHRNLLDNKETVIKPNNTTYEIYLPVLDEINPATVSANKKLVDVAETMNIETNFDAVEFKHRLTMIEKHMEAEPELIQVKVRADDLNYFQFGKKYYMIDDTDSVPMTPYKMLHTFTNISGLLQLEHDILFFSSGLDLNTTV